MHIKAKEFITEIEHTIDDARKLKEFLGGPLIHVDYNENELQAQIHTLEGVLKIAREMFEEG